MRRLPVLLVLLLTAGGCRGAGSDSAAPQPSTSLPADLAPYVQVHSGPVGLTAAEDGSVWAVGAGNDTVVRIPAGATEPDLTARVAGTPLRATAAYGAVWVTSFEGRRLVRLD